MDVDNENRVPVPPKHLYHGKAKGGGEGATRFKRPYVMLVLSRLLFETVDDVRDNKDGLALREGDALADGGRSPNRQKKNKHRVAQLLVRLSPTPEHDLTQSRKTCIAYSSVVHSDVEKRSYKTITHAKSQTCVCLRL